MRNTKNTTQPMNQELHYLLNFEEYTTRQLEAGKYFSPEACNKYLAMKGDIPTEKLAYNTGAILRAAEKKTIEELAEDIVYKSLVSDEDQQYMSYCHRLQQELEGNYSIYLLDEEERARQERSAVKKNRHSKNKKRKKHAPPKLNQGEPPDDKPNLEQKDAEADQAEENNNEIEVVEKGEHCRSEVILPADSIADQTNQPLHSLQELPAQQSKHYHHKHPNYEEQKQKKKLKAINTLMSEMLQSFIDQVSSESNNYVQYRKIAFARIQEGIKVTLLANRIELEHTLQLFGSCALGLSTPDSDIDIVLNANCSKAVQQELLKRLAHYFSSMRWVSDCQLILYTVVPVLKLTVDVKVDFPDHPRLNVPPQKLKRPLPPFHVDLSLECRGTENHLGVKSTSFIKEILEEHPSLRSIIILTKMLVRARNFHLTYLGGVNSYVLFLLIYSVYRQLHLQEVLLFKATTEVLRYIGAEFNHTEITIDLSLSKPLVRREIFQLDNDKLTIVNPLGENPPFVNTNCYLIRDIQKALLELHELMMQFRRNEVESQSHPPLKPKDATLRFKQLLKSFLH